MSMIDPQPCPPSDGTGSDSCAAPSLAATGLCLSDGTPIAVLFGQSPVTCGEDSGEPESLGWVNLLTGSYTAGAVPAGAKSCGEARDFELGQWCDLDEEGEVIAAVLVQYEYDEDTGELIGTTILTPDGQPYTVVGTLGACPSPDICDQQIIVVCKCDDVDGDGIGEINFSEFWGFDPCGEEDPVLLGTYLDGDPNQPYEPINPIECAIDGDPVTVQARRAEISDGDVWDIDVDASEFVQSVTATAVRGSSEITDSVGTTTLWPSESASWSVVKDYEMVLRGILQITAGAGSTVTINWTEEVAL